MKLQTRRLRSAVGLTAALLVGVASVAGADLIREGKDGVGRPIAPWGEQVWLNSPPLTLPGLRGKVLLVRFWTEGCGYCTRTAPALNALHREFSGQGLVVIGMYHPKPPRDESPSVVARAAGRLGFGFPIALDNDWATLRRWWLDTGDRAFTSATFLIDRRGILRAIHPGGEFHLGGGREHAACRRDYAALHERIAALLRE
jgi:thiol-disulfide isomerase/thioredoxin